MYCIMSNLKKKLLIKAIAHESKYLQMISIQLKSMYELKLEATVMYNFI